MAYEIVIVEGFEETLVDAGFSDTEVVSLMDKIEKIAEHPKPLVLTERVLDTPVRKFPLGNFRVFLCINENIECIYCLAVIHRKKCYKKEEISKVLTILRNEVINSKE